MKEYTIAATIRGRDSVRTTATVTCIERGKAKTYTGELMGRDFGGVHLGLWDKTGSSYIKYIKRDNIISISTTQS